MKELTAEMIVDGLTPSDPRLSPDGRLVAFVVAPVGRREEHSRSAIWLAPADGSAGPRRLTAGEAEDKAPRWSPDGDRLYFLSDRSERGKAQLHRMPARGPGEAEALTAWKSGISGFVPLPGNRRVALLCEDEPSEEEERRQAERDDAEVFGEGWPYHRLRLLDVGTGEVRTVDLGKRHVAEVAPDHEGKRLAVVAWPTPELDNARHPSELHLLDLASEERRLACELPSGGQQLSWRGETLLYLSGVAPGATTGLAAFAVHVPTGEPGMLTGGLRACPVELCEVRALGSDPLALVARGLDTTLERLDPTTGELARLSHHAGELHSPTASDDGSVLAAIKNDPEAPPEVWAGSPEGPMRRLTNLRPELGEVAFGARERLSWTSSDGLGMDGLLVLPPGKRREDGPFPTLTLVHGGPYGRWSDSLRLSWAFPAQWLAAHGYAVFLPNPRGGMGHGPEFASLAAGAVGQGDYEDVMAGVDLLVGQGVADAERLGIGGWSQGGYMTAWAVGQSDRFKAGVMGAGVSDWGMMLAESDMPRFEAELGGSTGWEGPGPHRHDEFSPASYVHRVKTPVLILHGEKDERVPAGQARHFARGLRHYGCPYELVVYPREPHALRERNHQIDVLRRSLAWFDRWVRPREEADG